MTARGLVRWVLIGRREGLRARVRRALGVFQWLDRGPRSETEPPPPAPAQAPATPAPAAAADVEPEGTEGWVRVLDARDLKSGEIAEVLLGDRPVVVACVDDALFAVDGTCPHAGGPLGDGVLEGSVLTCPWHGWSWDVKTGRSLVDEKQSVETLQVKASGGGVWVRSV